jgi:hypothetical protein
MSRRWRRRASLALACGLAACASLNATARVSPPIAGALAGDASAYRGVTIARSVRHHDNPRLGAVDAAIVGKDGRFDFPPLNLEVTAQEFSKVYVLTLSVEQNGRSRTIYREEGSREALRARLELTCDFAVAADPAALPCRAAP